MTEPGLPTRIIAALSTAVACLDSEGVIVLANDAFCSMVGTPVERLVGIGIHAAPGYEANAGFLAALELTTSDGATRRVRHPGGGVGTVLDSSLIRSGDYVLIEVTDVTEKVNEHRRAASIEAVRDVIWSRADEFLLALDLVEGTLLSSPTVREHWPIEQLEVALREHRMLEALDCPTRWVDPWTDERSLFDGRVERAIAEVFTTGVEQRHQVPTPVAGEIIRYFDTQLAPWEVDGERRGVVILSRDLTSLLRARSRGSVVEETMHQLLAQLPVTLWDIDLRTRLVRALFPDAADAGDPVGGQPRPVAEVLGSFDVDSQGRLLRILEYIQTRGSAALQVTTADGQRRLQISLRLTTQTVLDESPRVLAVITDVTAEVAQAEAASRLAHASHVMRFAQGVAHDFGNVAQVVGGYSEMLLRNQDPAVVEQAARRLGSAARRAVEVSRRIAKIAQVQQVVNGPVDISALVESVAPDLQQLLGSGIVLHLDVREGLVGFADSDTVASALENLCQNAAEAMHGTGSIHISVAPVLQSGRVFVEVAVADDGPGIPPELLDRVFDPFVTGRPEVGTGLGLYLIQEYLYSCGGEVHVESSSAGATFRLRLERPS